jgi:hypothetical protein
MPLPIPANSNSEDEYDYSSSESEQDSDNSTLTGNNLDNLDSDDDDEYFIRFNSSTNYDHVDYLMIGSTCYEFPDDQDSEANRCLGCQHDVLVYFINGYVEQQMMDKNTINDMCQLQGIDLSSHNIFEHLLE